MRLLPLIFILVMVSSVEALASQPISAKLQGIGSSLPNGHKEIQQGHPCEYAGLDLANVTGFFMHQWHARFRDLKPDSVQRWIEHNGIEDSGVTLVRVFNSRLQAKLAVVSAKRAPVFNGQEFPTLHCIVKINGNLAMTHTGDELLEILSKPDSDV